MVIPDTDGNGVLALEGVTGFDLLNRLGNFVVAFCPRLVRQQFVETYPLCITKRLNAQIPDKDTELCQGLGIVVCFVLGRFLFG